MNINKTFGSDWLDEHCGCDFAKAMEGDVVEIKKMRNHLKNETDRIRRSKEYERELVHDDWVNEIDYRYLNLKAIEAAETCS